MRSVVGTLVWLCALWAHAGPASTHKALSRRAQAQELLESLSQGADARSVANRLQFLGEQAYAAAELGALLHHSVDTRQRQTFVWVLAALAHPSAEPVLLGLLSDDDGAIRMAAVQGLGRLGSRQVVRIRPLLFDKTLGVRKEAARALGASGEKRMGRPLVDAARAEGEPEVRSAMLLAVGQLKDKSQATALVGFLTHSSESTRFAAAHGLCLLGAAQGFAFARRLLASEDRFARRQALALFDGVGGPRARRILVGLLDDDDRALAAQAARRLHQAGEPKMLEWLVLKSHHAEGEEKLLYETELETLRLADDQRRAILAQAGIE
ncbi:MAG: HEAT repeat domain-containing protein [Myxococcota bacterium]